MEVRILKLGMAGINTILFLIVSVAYLHVVDSIEAGISAIEPSYLISYFSDHRVFIGITIVEILLVFFAKRISKLGFVICIGLLSYYNLSTYFLAFDKIILLFTFVHLITSIYFFALWQQELEIVVYWPGFRQNDIGKKNVYNIPVLLTLKKGRVVKGFLSNWGEEECFFISENLRKEPVRGSVNVAIDFEGIGFKTKGKVVTSYGDGVGIKFNFEANRELTGNTWRDFFTIISHRGYNPRYVRV